MCRPLDAAKERHLRTCYMLARWRCERSLARHDHITPLLQWRDGSSTMKVSSFILHILSSSPTHHTSHAARNVLILFVSASNMRLGVQSLVAWDRQPQSAGPAPRQTLLSLDTPPEPDADANSITLQAHNISPLPNQTTQNTSSQTRKSTNLTRPQPLEFQPLEPRSLESQALEPQPPAPPQSSHTVPCHTHPSTSA